MSTFVQVRPSQLSIMIWPLVAAGLLAWWASIQMMLKPNAPLLKTMQATSTEQIESLFDAIDYRWPLNDEQNVPRVLIDPLPVDLNNDVNTERKKALFIRLLLPVIIAENQLIRSQRRFLQHVFANGLPERGGEAATRLDHLARYYRVSGSMEDRAVQRRLLDRVNTLPVALVLAQAANESGWGTSRFVRQGNNLFGQWTFNKQLGLVPLQRSAGQSHRVRVFPSLRDSVRAYMHNLNTHQAYRMLRTLRARYPQLASTHAVRLAAGLQQYSSRGNDYVSEIRRLITDNHLERFDQVSLRHAMPRMARVRQLQD